MKKFSFLLVLLVFLVLSVNAQIKKDEMMPVTYNVALTLANPGGDAGNFYGYVWGLDVQGVMNVATSIDGTASVGYLEFGRRVGHYRADFIPILVGGRYHFSDMIYGGLQIGVSVGTTSGVGSMFTWAPSVGVKISDHFDISLKYQSGSKSGYIFSFIGLRGAYTF